MLQLILQISFMDFIYEYSIPEKTKKSVRKSQKIKNLIQNLYAFATLDKNLNIVIKKVFYGSK